MPYPAYADGQRRYNDKDIQADFARLHNIAVAYLDRYTGTWHVLRQAKAVIQSGVALQAEQLRVVCNTMLSDPSVSNMPEPIGHTLTFKADEHAGKVISFPGGEDITPTRRPQVIECASKVHTAKPFWWSTHTNAYLIHIVGSVQVEYHTPEYYTNDNTWWNITPPYEKRFSTRVRLLCKEMRRIPQTTRAAAPDEIEGLIADGRRWCSVCADQWYSNPGSPDLPAYTGA